MAFCLCVNHAPPPIHTHTHLLELYFPAKLVMWWTKMISAHSLRTFVLIWKIHKGSDLPKIQTTDRTVGWHLDGTSWGPWTSPMTMEATRSLVSQILTPKRKHFFLRVTVLSICCISLCDLVHWWLSHRLQGRLLPEPQAGQPALRTQEQVRHDPAIWLEVKQVSKM